MPLLSKKATTVFWPWLFCRRLFLVAGKSVNTTFWFRIELVAPGLISRDDVFRKQWILVTHGNEVSRSFNPFGFLLVCELVRYKSGADLRLAQIIANDGVRRVFDNAQILRNKILSSVADLVPAFVALYRSFLKFCLSMADPNVAYPQSFPSRRENVWTIRKHVFCSRLPSRTSAATFHVSPLQFSSIFSWLRSTGCSRFTMLVACSLRCVSILMSLKNHAHARIHE